MATIAPRSSIIANAVRNIFNANGTRPERSEAMPNEKAISVAMGTPQPFANSVPLLKIVKINAGTSIPPTAPAMGNTDCLKDASSPLTISRFISMPTWKKKMAISPSLIQCSTVCGMVAPKCTSAFQKLR